MVSALLALSIVSVPQTGTIEVPFKIAEDAIVVDAVVNGKKVSAMFDTGFSGTLVLNNTINLGPPTGTVMLRDFVGQFEAQTVKVRSLKLGQKDIKVQDMEVVLRPPENYSEAYNTHVDGIMGLEVVSHAVTEINFQRSRFIFHPDSMDITKRTPDNKRTFLARLLPTGKGSLEMEVFTKDRKRMKLALDTGNAFYATTHKDVLERVGIWPADRKPQFMKLSSVASGTVESFYMKMPETTIFGVPVQSSVWSIIDLPSSSAGSDGTIGFGFLRNFNIIIDYERRRVWLEKFTDKVENEAPGDIGLSAFYVPSRKRVVVVRIAPEGPAEKAGIKEGDEILSVDGKELLTPNFRAMERILRGEKGTKVRLAVSRGGNLSRYELERVQLVNE